MGKLTKLIVLVVVLVALFFGWNYVIYPLTGLHLSRVEYYAQQAVLGILVVIALIVVAYLQFRGDGIIIFEED